MGKIWGRNQNDKKLKISIFRGDSNTHPKHMILWRTYDKYGKITGFCENFMSTETFT